MEYLQAIQRKESPREGQEKLSDQQRLMEALVFGLRMNAGVSLKEMKERYDTDFPLQAVEKIGAFRNEGLLTENDGMICVTDRGRCVLDEISARLI
jgi:coproporphyrinogen III oxidase-like Fe-S oxidoreductase